MSPNATVEARPGPGLIGRCVPDHPDHPITFCSDRGDHGWWYGHQCSPRCPSGRAYLSWATGCYFGTVTVLEDLS